MAKYRKPTLTAGLALAIALTLSCSGDGGSGGEPPPGTSSDNIVSSSSDAGGGSPSSSGVSSSVVSSSSSDVSSSSSEPAHVHAWGDWVVATAATCEAAGSETRTCSGDQSHTETQPIAKLSWGSWEITRHASQNEHGEETRTCPTTPLTTEKRDLYKCGEAEYDPVEEFCQSSGVVKPLCGTATYSSSQICESGIVKTLFTDARDNKVYKSVTIGGKVWMAENLNYDATGSKCYAEGVSGVSADSVSKNCAKYGRLYNWATAMGNSASSTAVPSGVQGVCPSGWHIPSNGEWNALMRSVNPTCSDNSDCAGAGTKLKAASGWNPSAVPAGTDEFGFSALPGGYGYSGGDFYDVGYYDVGNYGSWWSASESNSNYATIRSMDYNYESVDYGNYGKYSLFSVRCVQD